MPFWCQIALLARFFNIFAWRHFEAQEPDLAKTRGKLPFDNSGCQRVINILHDWHPGLSNRIFPRVFARSGSWASGRCTWQADRPTAPPPSPTPYQFQGPGLASAVFFVCVVCAFRPPCLRFQVL